MSAISVSMLTEDKSDTKYILGTLAIKATRKLVSYYNRELEPFGLTIQQAIAVRILYFNENISQVEFARHMGVSKPTALNMLRRLEAMDFIKNESHPERERHSVLSISDKTRKMMPEIKKKVIQLEKTIESQIGSSNLKRIVDDLSLFLDVRF